LTAIAAKRALPLQFHHQSQINRVNSGPSPPDKKHSLLGQQPAAAGRSRIEKAYGIFVNLAICPKRPKTQRKINCLGTPSHRAFAFSLGRACIRSGMRGIHRPPPMRKANTPRRGHLAAEPTSKPSHFARRGTSATSYLRPISTSRYPLTQDTALPLTSSATFRRAGERRGNGSPGSCSVFLYVEVGPDSPSRRCGTPKAPTSRFCLPCPPVGGCASALVACFLLSRALS